MKTAIIKQKHDVFGPWSSVSWDPSCTTLISRWPNKAALFEMTLLFEADWFVLDTYCPTDYIKDLHAKNPNLPQILNRYVSDTVDPKSVLVSEYDLVICADPVFPICENSKTVFSYIAQEHWDSLYSKSVGSPLSYYDVFLDHMGVCTTNITKLPASISFPYPQCPDKIKSLFGRARQEAVWVEWRSIVTILSKTFWDQECDEYIKRLCNDTGFDIRTRAGLWNAWYGVSEIPLWGDVAEYYGALSECKYYLGIGRDSGAGQGLVDAASLGCFVCGKFE